MQWYLAALKKYAVFSGRARRSEYWYFALFNILFNVALAFVDGLMGTFNRDAGMGVLGAIYTFALIIPGIAVSVRRLHDTGRSGWWMLIVCIPIIGALVLLYFLVQDSQPDANQYGANPKQIGR